MGDINSIGSVVRILETPQQKIVNGNILYTCFRVQFPQVRKNLIVHLTFWGNLARDVATYYKTNDYILIEGYLSLHDKQFNNIILQKQKKVNITVFKIYPFLLSGINTLPESNQNTLNRNSL